jgi:hypothetical protein
VSDSNNGMLVVQDTFTDADREALRELSHHERHRTEEVLREVEDGTIVCSEEQREVFSFEEPSIGAITFDVRGIKNGILAGRIPTAVYRMEEIPEHFYQHVLTNNGVEPERLPKVTAHDLERPGIMVQWPDSENSTLIDGNHRLCRRYQLGLIGFRFFLVHLGFCLRHICSQGEEESLFDSRGETLHREIKKIGK